MEKQSEVSLVSKTSFINEEALQIIPCLAEKSSSLTELECNNDQDTPCKEEMIENCGVEVVKPGDLFSEDPNKISLSSSRWNLVRKNVMGTSGRDIFFVGGNSFRSNLDLGVDSISQIGKEKRKKTQRQVFPNDSRDKSFPKLDFLTVVQSTVEKEKRKITPAAICCPCYVVCSPRLRNWSAHCLSHAYFEALILFATIWSLVADDIFVAFLPQHTDIVFQVVTTICLLLFIMELILMSSINRKYIFSFWWWLDFVAAISLTFDLPWISNYILNQFGVCDRGENRCNNSLSRMTQVARIGKFGRLLRLLRIVRVIRLVKLFRPRKNVVSEEELTTSTKDHSNRNDSLNNSSTRKNSENQVKKEGEITLAGKRISSLITMKVVVGILLLILALPMFEYSESNSDMRESSLTGLETISRSIAEHINGSHNPSIIVGAYALECDDIEQISSIHKNHSFDQDLTEMNQNYLDGLNKAVFCKILHNILMEFESIMSLSVLVEHSNYSVINIFTEQHKKYVQLRDFERYWVTSKSKGMWTGLFNDKDKIKAVAVLQLLQTSLVVFILIVQSTLLTRDVHVMFIAPLERILSYVRLTPQSFDSMQGVETMGIVEAMVNQVRRENDALKQKLEQIAQTQTSPKIETELDRILGKIDRVKQHLGIYRARLIQNGEDTTLILLDSEELDTIQKILLSRRETLTMPNLQTAFENGAIRDRQTQRHLTEILTWTPDRRATNINNTIESANYNESLILPGNFPKARDRKPTLQDIGESAEDNSMASDFDEENGASQTHKMHYDTCLDAKPTQPMSQDIFQDEDNMKMSRVRDMRERIKKSDRFKAFYRSEEARRQSFVFASAPSVSYIENSSGISVREMNTRRALSGSEKMSLRSSLLSENAKNLDMTTSTSQIKSAMEPTSQPNARNEGDSVEANVENRTPRQVKQIVVASANPLRNYIGDGAVFTEVLHNSSEITKIAHRLENYDTWGFDCIELDELSCGNALLIISCFLAHNVDLFRRTPIQETDWVVFVQRIQEGYIEENPYHNAIHAADVLFNSVYLFKHGGLTNDIPFLEFIAMLLSAIIHDFRHPGNTNDFETKTGTYRAILYNDKSVCLKRNSFLPPPLFSLFSTSFLIFN